MPIPRELRARIRSAAPPAVLLASVLATGLLACGGVADDGKLPPNVQDPTTLQTPSGAVSRYWSALSHLGTALDMVMAGTGILTDELATMPVHLGLGSPFTAVDSRTDLSLLGESSARKLYDLRGQAREARGFLAAYAPDSSPALRGQMFAVEGFAEIYLADLFCSGIPLSTVDFNGNYTLTPGFTTIEVYRHAAGLFDSALAISQDSVTVMHLAAIGKGRALLGVGDYGAAAAAVSGVPDDYTYQAPFTPRYDGGVDPTNVVPDSSWLWFFAATYSRVPATMTVADREGGHGLDYRSSGDPRTAVTIVGDRGPEPGGTMYFPAKYPLDGVVNFTVASGIEARLIEAEAALQASAEDLQWLATLNRLRQTVGLPDTADPGTATGRVDLLFRERAFWLFLTGHRQGDLRRLVRRYVGHATNTVYPSGQYPGGSGTYGDEVVVPFPASERDLNPQYTGCFNRSA